MRFTMLSLMTDEGFVTVHECDTIVLDDDGRFREDFGAADQREEEAETAPDAPTAL